MGKNSIHSDFLGHFEPSNIYFQTNVVYLHKFCIYIKGYLSTSISFFVWPTFSNLSCDSKDLLEYIVRGHVFCDIDVVGSLLVIPGGLIAVIQSLQAFLYLFANVGTLAVYNSMPAFKALLLATLGHVHHQEDHVL